MADDITALAAPVAPVAGNGSVVLIAAAEQATRLGFAPRMPFTVLVSSSLAAGTVIAVATNAVGCEAQSRARSHA